MNLLGHTYVAAATGRSDPEFLLGAVLPDLASIAHVRLDRARLTGGVGDGVACHHRTDAAFHAHPAFMAGASTIRRQLVDRGLGTGPARAVGHIGWELLLDGTLVDTVTNEQFRTAMGVVDRASEAVVTSQAERWRGFLANTQRTGRLHYDDPAWVASRLHRMLAGRPRLAFAASAVPTVTEVLDAHVEPIGAAATAVLDEVTAQVIDAAGEATGRVS